MTEERNKVYTNCRSALAEGGALVIDNSFYPRRTDRVPALPTLQSHGAHVLPDGTPFQLEIRTQPPWPSMHYSRTLLLRSPGGALIHEREIDMDYVPPEATVSELKRAGFDRIDTHDGYSTVTVTPDHIRSRQVFVAHV